MSYFYNNQTDEYRSGRIVVTSFVAIIVPIVVLMAVIPPYKVWSREQAGKAQLSEARYSKQTQLEQAKANLESEKLNALAEVERAKGAAQAIKIEGGNLSDNYIKYLWVRNLENSKGNKIYIPTEAGLPLLEARNK